MQLEAKNSNDIFKHMSKLISIPPMQVCIGGIFLLFSCLPLISYGQSVSKSTESIEADENTYIVKDIIDIDKNSELKEGVIEKTIGSDFSLQNEHERGVELARSGKHEEGLQVLQELLVTHSYYYPLIRDYIIIKTWMGDCEGALRNFDQLASKDKLEGYFIIPVADCLVAKDRQPEAVQLLEEGLAWWPDDTDIKDTMLDLQRHDDVKDRPVLDVSLGSDESDAGNREWSLSTGYKQVVVKNTHLFANYLIARAADPAFNTGNLNRFGVGVRYQAHEKVSLQQEFSWDQKESGENGSTTFIAINPNNLWEVNLGYASYANDIPLRAKANDTESDRLSTGADYHSPDYRWTGGASAARYNFSDDNTRQALLANVGYAFELKPMREQRLIVEFYSSRNSLSPVLVSYYNPVEDVNAKLVYKTDFVYQSKFKRHVDHLYLHVGAYKQKGFGTKQQWGLRFEQDYNINDAISLFYGVAYNSNIYDGNRENITGLFVTFDQRF